jgi:hypothetical protein
VKKAESPKKTDQPKKSALTPSNLGEIAEAVKQFARSS